MSEHYTLDEVKSAFWETFHEVGERWFSYLGTREENEEHTVGEWQDFLENLKEEKK